MNLPYAPTPPAWYWKLPLVWRQRYCRYIVHPWWSVYNFCDTWVSRQGVRKFLELLVFKWYCFRADRFDAIARRHPRFEDYAFAHPRIWRMFH